MKQVRLLDCAACALLGVVVALLWPGLRVLPVPPAAGVPLLLAGIAEAGFGSFCRARVREGRIGFGPGRIPPVFVARAAAFATATVFAGVFAAGLWAALAVRAFFERDWLVVAQRSLLGDLVATCCAVVLIGGALWLRRCCRAPRDGRNERPLGG